MKDRTLALAGAFQAAELVRQAANHGTWSGYAATSCLNSLFAMEATGMEDIYGDRRRMQLGIETLLSVLQGDDRHTDSLRYVVGLLQIEKKFRRSGAMQDQVGESLDRISHDGEGMELHEQQDLQAAEIAQLYTDTVSQLTPRIVVSGRPQYLKNDRTVNWVRTLLMAGLRSATLWTQLGGGRFELMFGRKKIISEAQSLLAG